MSTQCLPNNHPLRNGEYVISDVLASGEFSITYLARSKSLSSPVVIKEFFISDYCNRDPESLSVSVRNPSKNDIISQACDKFKEESITIKGFSHRGVVKVLDVFEENGTVYYVMEYIKGLNLEQYIKTYGPMSHELAVDIIAQVADAMDYAHAHNKLHLNIKPENILITPDNHAILISFGEVKRIDIHEYATVHHPVIVKYSPYNSIEMFGNDNKYICNATDIYSLAATLYTLITGLVPPHAQELIIGEDLRIIDDLPDNIYAAILGGMYMIISERISTMREFKDILLGRLPQAVIPDSYPITSPLHDTNSTGLAYKHKKRKAMIAIILAIAIAAVAGLSAYYLLG